MGRFKQVGLKCGKRIDIGYWQACIDDADLE